MVKYDANISGGPASAAVRADNYPRAHITSISRGYAHRVIFGGQVRDDRVIVNRRAGGDRRVNEQCVKLIPADQVNKRDCLRS